jgi:adenylosuccinate synthase
VKRAAIVVDLGFGDAGKGSIVDSLVRSLGAHTVVRFNGGSQAGHNVVTDDGRHHTFAQIGAGAFVPGVRTYLSRFVVLHPTALLVEARVLSGKGVSDVLERVTVSDEALVTTPFHQAAGRLRELGRGSARHGSCGAGVGETVSHALRFPEDAVRARELGDPRALRPKLERIRDRLRAEAEPWLASLGSEPRALLERSVLEAPHVIDDWSAAARELATRGLVVPEERLGEILRDGAVVFEGAHGVLLDEWRGFHPHTTWSNCTFENALALLEENGFSGRVERIGVLRTYASRHGPGPFPTEAPELSGVFPELHNPTGEWQGAFRVGWPDFVLARYALEVCGGVSGLAVTHLDALGKIARWRVCTGYRGRAGELVTSLRAGAPRDLDHQSELTRTLLAVEPVYDDLALGGDRAASYVLALEAVLGVRAWIESRGPTAGSKTSRRP